MKKFLTLLVAIGVCNFSWSAILTVSNNATYPGQYSSIQTAVDAAATGDTLYIQPSASVYNEFTVTINKRLVILGSGINPQRPSRLSTSVYLFVLGNANASGSVISGIYFVNCIQSGSDAIAINNLVISDCMFYGQGGYITAFFGSNLLIENCIFASPYTTANVLQLRTATAGNTIQNNYIYGSLQLVPGAQALIRNNVFASGDANTIALKEYNGAYSSNVQVWNNIFYKSNPGTAAVAACEFKNNISYLTSDPIPTNGLSSGNINSNPLFVNFPVAGDVFSFNYDFHLQPGSPGISFGTDGRDAGMWGGTVPVNAGFEPPIPRIYQLSVNNSTVPVGGTIQLTIKATKAQ